MKWLSVNPLFQRNCEPGMLEDIVNSTVSPIQISLSLVERDKIGKGFTTIEILVELLQPDKLVPVTLYVVFELGLTKICDDILPVFHTKEVLFNELETLMVVVSPVHIWFSEAMIVNSGNGLTLIEV